MERFARCGVRKRTPDRGRSDEWREKPQPTATPHSHLLRTRLSTPNPTFLFRIPHRAESSHLPSHQPVTRSSPVRHDGLRYTALMRVLYCTDTYPPQVNGVSVVTAISVAGLRERGWDV